MTQPGSPGSPDAPGQPVAEPAVSRFPAATSASGGRRPSDEDEFACFYREHITRLITYLVYQGAAAHVAADLAQDTMTTAYRRWPDITSPRAYVYTVAYRAFLRHALEASELPVSEVPEPTIVLPRPGEAEAWLQEQEIVHVLRALPPRQRQVLALTVDGWTPAEIAEMLGMQAAAVRSNLKKARRSADKHRRSGEEGQ
jgi:RNA polymerase sigma factor (sigma-70 family)